eukprot:scaffold10456_cov90-Isochrysis_galbana.AAC.1
MVDNAYAELDAFNVAKKSALYQSVTREKAEDAARLAAQLEHEAAMEGAREDEPIRLLNSCRNPIFTRILAFSLTLFGGRRGVCARTTTLAL